MFKNLTISNLEEFIQILPRQLLPFHEYKNIATNMLANNMYSELQKTINNNHNEAVVYYHDNQIKGGLLLTNASFDSLIFEIPMYSANFICLGTSYYENCLIVNKLLKQLNIYILNLGIKHISVSLSTNDLASSAILNSLINKGFYLINTLLTFKTEKKYTVNKNLNPDDDKLIIRDAKPEDLNDIVNIAENSYRINRFYLDPYLDNEKCDQLHSISAKNSITDGFANIIFIAEYEGKVVGYYSGKKTYISAIGLIVGNAIISAVSNRYRGRGIFTQLDNALLLWFHENTDIAEMGTYINNIPVHRNWTNKNLPLVRARYQLGWYST